MAEFNLTWQSLIGLMFYSQSYTHVSNSSLERNIDYIQQKRINKQDVLTASVS